MEEQLILAELAERDGRKLPNEWNLVSHTLKIAYVDVPLEIILMVM